MSEPDATPAKLLYTLPETAKQLGISPKVLREHVRHGEIRYIATGRGTTKIRRMFTLEDMNDFIERRRRRDVPPALPPQKRFTPYPVTTAGSSGIVARLAAEKAAKAAARVAARERREAADAEERAARRAARAARAEVVARGRAKLKLCPSSSPHPSTASTDRKDSSPRS